MNQKIYIASVEESFEPIREQVIEIVKKRFEPIFLTTSEVANDDERYESMINDADAVLLILGEKNSTRLTDGRCFSRKEYDYAINVGSRDYQYSRKPVFAFSLPELTRLHNSFTEHYEFEKFSEEEYYAIEFFDRVQAFSGAVCTSTDMSVFFEAIDSALNIYSFFAKTIADLMSHTNDLEHRLSGIENCIADLRSKLPFEFYKTDKEIFSEWDF